MSLKKFISEVFRPTEGEVIIEGLRANIKSMEDNLLPMLEQMQDREVSKYNTYARLDAALNRNPEVKGYKKDTLIEYLTYGVKRLLDKQNDLIAYYTKSFKREVTMNGLDYRRANLLQLAASIDFYVDYLLKSLMCISSEAVKSAYQDSKMARIYEKEISSIDAMNAFAVVSTILPKVGKDLTKELDALADIPFVVENAEQLEAAYRGKLNPAKSNLLPVIGHFGLFVGDIYNDWVKFRYERAKVLRDLVAMDLAYKRQAAQGNMDASDRQRIENQIKNLEKRLARLDTHIKNIEDDV